MLPIMIKPHCFNGLRTRVVLTKDMNQDTKLGLALGMLVIGFAAAFCFPREDTPSWTTESVAETEDIDFIPVRSYQPKRQNDDNPATNHTANDVEGPDTVTPPEIEELSEPRENIDVPQVSVVVPIPSTLPTDATESESDTEATGATPQIDAKDTAHEILQPHDQAYVTQPGDTLTGIAYRFLGSSNRYQELFEYNRDVLRSPDDLSVGMELKIPVTGTSPVSSPDELASSFGGQDDGRIHEVRPGDTLEGISKRYFGTSRAVDLIQKANPAIKDPARLRVGMSLSIPQVQ